MLVIVGAPGVIRTLGLRIRSPQFILCNTLIYLHINIVLRTPYGHSFLTISFNFWAFSLRWALFLSWLKVHTFWFKNSQRSSITSHFLTSSRSPVCRNRHNAFVLSLSFHKYNPIVKHKAWSFFLPLCTQTLRSGHTDNEVMLSYFQLRPMNDWRRTSKFSWNGTKRE